MKTVDQVHFRVVDHGIFLPIALRLAREAGHVSYWTPHERAFPTVHDIIGDGFPEIERVESPWDDAGNVDVWVFPDIGFSPIQHELLRQGRLVWGARSADALESMRGQFLDALKETTLPVPPHEKIVGMASLRDFLREKENKWVKISRFRGDWETLHFRSWSQDECELDARSVKLGPWKDEITFYVFDEIKTKIEDGCDSYCIDGEFPSLIIHGMEAKDKAYLGTFQKFAELPEEMRRVNDAFGPVLGRYGYRSFFSTEVRITEEGESYFIDPTLRAGSPPSQVMCEMIGNLADIIWKGAQGELVEPEPAYRFGVQAMICARTRQHWNTVEIPKLIYPWVKCGFCCLIGDRLCFPPDPDETGGQIGWLVGVGNTAQAAIDHLRDNADHLPAGLTCEFGSIADLLAEVEKAEDRGMEFSDQEMPEPAVVLEDKQG